MMIGRILVLLLWIQPVNQGNIHLPDTAKYGPGAYTSISVNPKVLGECYTNIINGRVIGTLIITTTTFDECETKHGMWLQKENK